MRVVRTHARTSPPPSVTLTGRVADRRSLRGTTACMPALRDAVHAAVVYQSGGDGYGFPHDDNDLHVNYPGCPHMAGRSTCTRKQAPTCHTEQAAPQPLSRMTSGARHPLAPAWTMMYTWAVSESGWWLFTEALIFKRWGAFDMGKRSVQ
jgi:hypothetical protein